MYTLYRQSLLRWHHVDELSPQELQERLLTEHGQWAHRDHLQTWLKAPAQALPTLENNEDIHAHPCGEYVLQRLQNGDLPVNVVQGLLEEFLVKATVERVKAYRRYREQRGDYWTKEKLAQRYWEGLYEQFAEADKLVIHSEKSKLSKSTTATLQRIRTVMCQAHEIAEELIPLESLAGFCKDHSHIARMRKEYPDATVHCDVLSRRLVSAYRVTFVGEDLPPTCNGSILDKARSFYVRACAVATDAKLIAWPLACAESCHVAAYATLKCEELYRQQSWQGSRLTALQREQPEWPQKYPDEGMS